MEKKEKSADLTHVLSDIVKFMNYKKTNVLNSIFFILRDKPINRNKNSSSAYSYGNINADY